MRLTPLQAGLVWGAWVLAMTSVNAQEAPARWFMRADIQALYIDYSGAQLRDSLENLGFFLRADYLERGGITFGYNRTVLNGEGAGQDIEQDNVFVSGRWQTTPDWANGQITLRLDGYAIANDDATGATDDINVIAPQVSFLNYDRTFYADLGFAESSYGDSLLSSNALDVEQWTPTIGFGFNEQRDWLQLRAYLIKPSSPARAQGQDDTAALQFNWTHWTRNRFLGIDNFRYSALLGERVFAVDPDAGSVYNLNDLQTGAVSIGSEWVPGERLRLLLMIGVERYEEQNIGEEYDSAFAYLNFTYHWK
jgi:hypothetical protein